MTIEPKVGDHVTLTARVIAKSTLSLKVEVFNGTQPLSGWIAIGDVREILPRPIAIGDIVTTDFTRGYRWRVLAIEDDVAFLKPVTYPERAARIMAPTTKTIASLRRVD